MLLRATIHWPEQNHLNLWPLAFVHAIFLWNHMPNCTTGCSHIWGCPVYVLDPQLPDGKVLPEWKACTCHGQYMGTSMDNSSTGGSILNHQTGFLSPQYDLIHDNLFSMVLNARSGVTKMTMVGAFQHNSINNGHEWPFALDAKDSIGPALHDNWLNDVE